jgi:L-fuconolactonase
LSAFGPSRCLYGSDWPLAELGSGGTAAWRSTFLAAIGHLSPAEKYQVSGGAGVEFYRLAVP